MPKSEANAANIALEPQELWKTQKGADDKNKDDGRRLLQRVNNSLFTSLYYWPTSEKWKCLSSSLLAISGVTFSFATIGIALRNKFAFRNVRFQTVAVGYISGMLLLPASLAHYEFVMLPIAEKRATSCPVCLEVRQVGINLLFGCLVPVIMLPATFGLALSRRGILREMSFFNYLKYLFAETKPIFSKELPIAASVSTFTAVAGVYFEHKYIMNILEMLDFDPEVGDEIYDASTSVDETSYSHRISLFFNKLKGKLLG